MECGQDGHSSIFIHIISFDFYIRVVNGHGGLMFDSGYGHGFYFPYVNRFHMAAEPEEDANLLGEVFVATLAIVDSRRLGQAIFEPDGGGNAD